eukprot:jgi/Hompol1/5061/HPOL_004145-RA
MARLMVGFEGHAGAHSETVAIALFHSQPALLASIVASTATATATATNQTQAPTQTQTQASASAATPALETVGFESVEHMFEAVSGSLIHCGIVPIENSLTGSLYKVLDLLHQHSLHIIGETIDHPQHCLVALPGVAIEDITEIRSHPLVIDQCRTFLSSLPKHVAIGQSFDSAGSALEISERRLRNTAAIVGARAARIYGLNILKYAVEDDPNIVTRYVLIARDPVIPERHMDPRTAVSVALKNRTGAMFRALAVFSLRDINICKIESRPSQRSIRLMKPWEYILYIDIDGSIADAPVANALRHLQEIAVVRILGSYPRFPSTQPVVSAGHFGIGMTSDPSSSSSAASSSSTTTSAAPVHSSTAL